MSIQVSDFPSLFEMLRPSGFPRSGEASEELPAILSRRGPCLEAPRSRIPRLVVHAPVRSRAMHTGLANEGLEMGCLDCHPWFGLGYDPSRRRVGLDFARVIDAVAGFLERENAPFALVGAFALHAYGLSRATFDLDFVTEAEVRERLIAYLESLGYETLHASSGYSNHLHSDAAAGRLDFIYVAGETSRRLFSAPGTTLRLGGRDLPVPRAEHLVAMKVHAMKNDPERVFQEMADIRVLLRVPGIDEDEVRGYFERAGMEDRYIELKRSL